MSMNQAKIATSVLFALSSSTALAQDFHNGFYIGLNSGASFVTGQTNSELITGVNFINPVSSTTRYRDEDSARGYNGGISLGWNFYADREYVYGIELSGNASSNTANQTFWNFTPDAGLPDLINFQESWKIRYTVDLTFKPGVLISDSAELYGILGVSTAELKTKLKNLVPVLAGSSPLTFNDSKDVYGFVLGAGAHKQLCNHFGLFTSYQYTYYGSKHLSDGVEGNPSNGNDNFQNFIKHRKLRVDTNVFKIGLVYTF